MVVQPSGELVRRRFGRAAATEEIDELGAELRPPGRHSAVAVGLVEECGHGGQQRHPHERVQSRLADTGEKPLDVLPRVRQAVPGANREPVDRELPDVLCGEPADLVLLDALDDGAVRCAFHPRGPPGDEPPSGGFPQDVIHHRGLAGPRSAGHDHVARFAKHLGHRRDPGTRPLGSIGQLLDVDRGEAGGSERPEDVPRLFGPGPLGLE
ncbi:hypothetical protein GCM10020369_05000 [Cryptosporangium minutisporangium]|uniref:Uncharacterized protein n=1 Tax=Cryptosporangium minutisporangium TaxID=113569 RepID=A0ABP6SRX4_9ACTN